MWVKIPPFKHGAKNTSYLFVWVSVKYSFHFVELSAFFSDTLKDKKNNSWLKAKNVHKAKTADTSFKCTRVQLQSKGNSGGKGVGESVLKENVGQCRRMRFPTEEWDFWFHSYAQENPYSPAFPLWVRA